MTLEGKLDKILPLVEKPGRYIGSELHSIVKDGEKITTKLGFAFPDIYEIGMSYLGLQIIYKVLNDMEDVYCERIFAPALDMEKMMRENDIPLFTIETKRPVKNLDMVGFTLQYELSYTNILNMLDLAGVPFKRAERNDSDPFIIGGGPCAFNPEPLGDFFDFFVLGDGEEILVDICKAHREWKKAGGNRNDFMLTISQLPGIYVPSFYKPVYGANNVLDKIEKTEISAPDSINKNIISQLDQTAYPTEPIVPFVETVHDRSVLELFRGCSRGCRFCQAGMIYRPVRERSMDCAINLIEKQLDATGYDELSLLSLSTGDYSDFEKLAMNLIKTGRDKNVAISLPSLRLDSFSFKVLNEIQQYKKTGLTFAPEAGTQRLRDVINKNISDDDIYNSMGQAISMGWNTLKLYFMIGLPTETFEDLDGIAEIAKKITDLYYKDRVGKRTGRFKVTISISNFVPKPHTPFQWVAQDSPQLFNQKHNYLREKFRRIKGAHLSYHDSGASHIEAVLARGDRNLSSAIIKAWEMGCKFDGWREHFKYEKWLHALNKAGIDYSFYTSGKVTNGKVLPWALINSGVSEKYLRSEWDKALKEETSPDCRTVCNACGINKFTPCERKEFNE